MLTKYDFLQTNLNNSIFTGNFYIDYHLGPVRFKNELSYEKDSIRVSKARALAKKFWCYLSSRSQAEFVRHGYIIK